MIHIFLRILLLCVTLHFSTTPLLHAADDFDFESFFKSLLEDEELGLKEHTPPQRSTASSTPTQATPVATELQQTISPTKKGNFLSPLRFENQPTAAEKKSSAPAQTDKTATRIKVPSQKREAFLHYAQQLIDTLDDLRSSMDSDMRESLPEFLSVSDSIIKEILAVDRQYLLRTFYHKDFNNLREKIYNEVTQKKNAKSLVALTEKVKKSAQKKSTDKDEEIADEEELTFSKRSRIPYKQREQLIKAIRELTTKELKSIADTLAKIPAHKHATEEKKKKIAAAKEREKAKPRASGRGAAPWRPSHHGGGRGSGRRSYGSDYGSSRGGYGGYGGYSPYRSDYKNTDKEKPFEQKTDKTPSSSSGVTGTRGEKNKTKDETLPEVFLAIKDLSEGSGKQLTAIVNKLAAKPSGNKEAYLFDPNLGAFIAHPNLAAYLAGFQKIAQDLRAYDATRTYRTQASGTAPSTQASRSTTPIQSQKTAPTKIERDLKQQYEQLSKKLFFALFRAQNCFCIMPHALDPAISPANPRLPQQIFTTYARFNPEETYRLITQYKDLLAEKYPKEAPSLDATLTKYCTDWDAETVREFDDLVQFCQDYYAAFKAGNAVIRALPAAATPADYARENAIIKRVITRFPRIKNSIESYDMTPQLVDYNNFATPAGVTSLDPITTVIAENERMMNLSWRAIALGANQLTQDTPTKTMHLKIPVLQDRARAFTYKGGGVRACLNAAFTNLIDTYLTTVIANIRAAGQDVAKALSLQNVVAAQRVELAKDGRVEINRAWRLP